jgi:selenocysteine lyase/cysteine desulfurase
VVVHDQGIQKCGIVTFTRKGESASAISRRFLKQGINTSVSTADSARLDMSPRGLDEMVRASVHYYNSEEEIERFCEMLDS